MKTGIEKAISLCIAAINNKGNGDDQAVMEIVRHVASNPYQGRGLGIGTFGYRYYRSSWDDKTKQLADRNGIRDILNWLTTLLYLEDSGNYTEKEILDHATPMTDDIIFNHVMKHIICNLVVAEKIEEAETYIPYFRKTTIFGKEEDNQDNGYMMFLCYYAKNGDPDNFFRYFKQAKPGVNRYEINEYKIFLVESYTKKNGLDKALALCQHKNLGDKFQENVLSTFAQQGKYDELKTILDKYNGVLKMEEGAVPSLLVTAYLSAVKGGLPVNDVFDELFAYASQVDPKLKFGDLKLRDNLLFSLGEVAVLQRNKARATQCSKAIKGGFVKKELNDYIKQEKLV